MEKQKNNPLHNIKLADLLGYLVENYGWEYLGEQVNIKCFQSDPSVASSLKFLRKTPWAREKLESLYLFVLREERRQKGSSSSSSNSNSMDDSSD